MNPLRSFLNLFGAKPKPSTAANQQWLQGYEAFEAGKRHYAGRRHEEAVACFDEAVECGFEDGELFSLRGSSLQALKWNIDAIEDFTRAISTEPDDCNLYFQRAMSKVSIGDQLGFLADVQEAIRLSRVESEATRAYNTYANETGHESVTQIYQFQLMMQGEMPEFLVAKRVEEAELRGRRKNKPQ